MDELRVDAERDVVQEEPVADAADVHPPLRAAERAERAERVVPIEADVAGEVIPGAERDADEGQVALDARPRRRAPSEPSPPAMPRRLRHGPARELGGVVALAEDVRLDPAPLRPQRELVRGRAAPARRAD